MKKFLFPHLYYRLLLQTFLANRIVDRIVKPVSSDKLEALKDVTLEHFDINADEYQSWVQAYYGDWRDTFGSRWHKKLLEFYTTFETLQPGNQDVFMDAAGALNSYVHNLKCKRVYMQDLRVSPKVRSQLGSHVTCIEGDAGAIPLPDSSIDKIACHHSFEHFQGYSDTRFISEVQRLLSSNGKCCIIPILIGKRYCEITDTLSWGRKFDERSRRVVDPTSVLPGGRECGHYARVYDVRAFQERILDHVDRSQFTVAIRELRSDGKPAPDLRLRCHRTAAVINRPYRALVITRK